MNRLFAYANVTFEIMSTKKFYIEIHIHITLYCYVRTLL